MWKRILPARSSHALPAPTTQSFVGQLPDTFAYFCRLNVLLTVCFRAENSFAVNECLVPSLEEGLFGRDFIGDCGISGRNDYVVAESYEGLWCLFPGAAFCAGMVNHFRRPFLAFLQ